MAGALGSLNIDMTLNTAKFTSAMRKSESQSVQFANQIVGQVRKIAREQQLAAEQSARAAQTASTFFKGLAGFLSVREVVRYADSWTELQNRLKLVTHSTQELNKATNDVFNIAQSSRQSLDSTAQVYQRFAENADRLGLSQQKVADLTDTVSKAVAISGASAASAEAALIQFGQALASGQLRGEELNSVMEQTPGLARAIAEGMGISIGELRKMAADGKTSIDQVIKALEKAKAGVDQKFATSVATVSQAFTNLQSSVTKYIGEANNSAGATQLLSGGMNALALNLDTVVRGAEALGAAVIAAKIVNWTKATYGQIVATQGKAQAELVAAKATQASTTAELEFARASMVSLQAQLKLAQTEAQRSAIRGQMRIQSAQIIAATQAETAATQRLAAAKKSATLLSRGLNGALGLLGGPVGIVTGLLTAGAIAVYEWHQKAEQARQKAIEFADSLDVTAEALRKMSAIDRQSAISRMAEGIDAQIDKVEALEDALKKANREGTRDLKTQAVFEYYGGDYDKSVADAREREIRLAKEAQDENEKLATQKAKISQLLNAEIQQYGMVSRAVGLYGKYLADANSPVENLTGKLRFQGTAFDTLNQSIQNTTQSMQAFSQQSLIVVSDDVQKSIDLSNRAIAKAKATGQALAKLNAEDVLASRKITADNPGYQKALDAEIAAQMAAQSKPKAGAPKINKTSVDYQKQYTETLSEMEARLSSLMADGKSIRQNGTTSTFKEYDALMADIAKNQEKFAAFGSQATEKLKAMAKEIDEAAKANAVSQFGYDKQQELEQMQFETSLIGKTRSEQERLNAAHQLDLDYRRMQNGLMGENLVRLQQLIEKQKEEVANELSKRELMKQDPVAGLQAGLQDFGESANNVMENVKNITTQAFSGMSDTLTDFVMTGKFKFGDFAKSILQDINRMVIKMLLFKAIEAGGKAMGFDMGFLSVGKAYGGYTGDGGKFEPKGIVHGGEFVFTKEATSRLGVSNLYRIMRAAQGYANGGLVGSLAGTPPATVPSTPVAPTAPALNIHQSIVVQGYGDAALNQALAQSAETGAQKGAMLARGMMLKDFGNNGEGRRILGV